MSSPSPEETVAFLQTHGVVFSELLQDLLRKKPDQPSLYILQRLCEEATARELRAAGLALTQKNNASNLLTARTLLEDMEKRVLPSDLNETEARGCNDESQSISTWLEAAKASAANIFCD